MINIFLLKTAPVINFIALEIFFKKMNNNINYLILWV
jgi:hypothetical protein